MGLLQLAQEAPEVPPETSVMEAVRTMTIRRIGAIAVTAGGKIVGVFTERDLMRRVVNEHRDPATTFIREVMSSPVQTVSDATSPAEAASLMRTHHIRHLVIISDKGALLGIVGLRYLLYDLMDDLERKVDGLQSYIMAAGPGG
jgi:CBS domain-containing protein